MSDLDRLRANLDAVQARIDAACARAGRDPGEVTLVAVSKTHPVEALRVLYEAGVRDFGESYVQEWQDKAPRLPDDVRWHFIGHLQSNKAKYLVDDDHASRPVHLVHSVDRRSVMKRLDRRSGEPVDVLLQVNTGDDPNKGGVAPGDAVELLRAALDYPALRLRGLMTIPPYPDDPQDNRPLFAELRRAFEACRGFLEVHSPQAATGFRELSMGMTADFEIAVEEGATMVRVGTALFGERDYDD